LQFKLTVFFSKLRLMISLGECLTNIVSKSEEKNKSDFLMIVPL